MKYERYNLKWSIILSQVLETLQVVTRYHSIINIYVIRSYG